MKITIFTPTYNRSEKLKRLYESLVIQEYSNLEWLIVDDGSSDDTKEVVRQLSLENKIIINYYYQENAGKQVAYNTAIDSAVSDIFICIDSDDYLLIDALNKLTRIFKSKVINNNSCCGVVFLDSSLNGTIIGTVLPSNVEYCKLYDLYKIHGVCGDKGIAFLTNVIKKYRFPIQESEKFITESLLYNRINQQYEFYCLNEILEVRDYQENGLSSKYNMLLIDNPKGASLYYKERSSLIRSYIELLRNNSQYFRFSFHSKNRNKLKKLKNKDVFILSYLIGYTLYIKDIYL
ncbi:glycosyltransferase family 2 protein [Photobacterium leiognathi]|uniref:glycosyltransferase family 2 protein n=1 Tax=Photobacterium leiognathi TaxID=553611 RepID=UPI00298250D4|nr:glycosyltransferase family 2 protein [Photobacterium leiognathi]